MREEKRSLRQQQIEKAAYEVLESKGYNGTSMVGIARQARASNETLYNWYGDKQGLFLALVSRNAAEVKAHLENALQSDKDAVSALKTLGPKLLRLLMSDRAIALNRAAAADGSGELGATLSTAGRETVLPLIGRVLERAKDQRKIKFDRVEDAAGLYLDLLVGDLQIRRVIGRQKKPTDAFCAERSERALKHLLILLN